MPSGSGGHGGGGSHFGGGGGSHFGGGGRGGSGGSRPPYIFRFRRNKILRSA